MFSPLYAFGFANGLMLGWLAAAIAPIIIHLWSRRRPRQTPWAAMDFLLAAVKKSSRRLRIEQWTLLAIRILLVVLLVFAVAEPFSTRSGGALPAVQNTHRVLLIDGSYSMGYRPTDKTRFDRAKELAKQIVADSAQGDAFTLGLLGCPPKTLIGRPSLDRMEVTREIDNLQLTHAGMDLSASIVLASRLVDEAAIENTRLARHEVFFLTDMQRVTWAPALSKQAAEELVQQASNLANKASIMLIDLGQPAAENLAVIDLRIIEPLMKAGRSYSLLAELRNFGNQPLPRQGVELLINSRQIQRREVSIEPQGMTTANFDLRLDSPGDYAVEVRAPGDNLDVDNRRFLIAPVRKYLRVLCIEGRPAADPYKGSTGYLAAALQPAGAESSDTYVKLEVATENALRERNLTDCDCLILANIARITNAEAQLLGNYLQGGGGLILFLGDQISPEQYNDVLGIIGQGRAGQLTILPAKIGPLVEQPQFRLDPLAFQHPIIQAFQGGGETALLTTPVFKYYKLFLPERAKSSAALSLGNGEPLVAAGQASAGRVVIVGTAAEPDWTAMPLWPSFVPLVQEIVAWCAGADTARRSLQVGQTPNGVLVNHVDTWHSGIVAARFGPPLNRNELFAVNLDTSESQLDSVSIEEFRNMVWPGVPLTHQTSWQQISHGGSVSQFHGSFPLHLGLLYAVLALLFVESYAAWRMGCRGELGG